jgi:hypothetical protein
MRGAGSNQEHHIGVLPEPGMESGKENTKV